MESATSWFNFLTQTKKEKTKVSISLFCVQGIKNIYSPLLTHIHHYHHNNYTTSFKLKIAEQTVIATTTKIPFWIQYTMKVFGISYGYSCPRLPGDLLPTSS